MKNSKKIIKVVGELMSFYYQLGIRQIEIDVKDGSEQMVVSIKGEKEKIDNERLEEVNELLNTPRQAQVEEYYWKLAGESGQASELSLLGMMIDKAEVSYEDSILEIKVYR
ncbi:hypothetical protein [Natroniella sp. ANB-PHB2]|uniref:hypothetical protein n=1 Tax=Natroniella sp. ANB-PHB2 TaxID=3384444 RepID=UPI0038D51171